MPNPVATSDLEARWRPLTDTETINADAFLTDAWALLVTRRPTIEADMVAGTITTENVIRVVSAMVLRVLKNPDGWLNEAVDDWSGRRHDLVASGLLHITDDELADVTPGRRRRQSVRLVVYGDA